MKSINIAPTWVWVVKSYFAFVRNKENPKVIKTFREEIERTGPAAVQLLKEYKSKSLRIDKREQIESQLIDWARRCDRALEKKTEGVK